MISLSLLLCFYLRRERVVCVRVIVGHGGEGSHTCTCTLVHRTHTRTQTHAQFASHLLSATFQEKKSLLFPLKGSCFSRFTKSKVPLTQRTPSFILSSWRGQGLLTAPICCKKKKKNHHLTLPSTTCFIFSYMSLKKYNFDNISCKFLVWSHYFILLGQNHYFEKFSQKCSWRYAKAKLKVR